MARRRTKKKRVDPKRKKALAGRRNVDEVVLQTVDGASRNVEIDYFMPSSDAATGKRGVFRVVRVDREIDAVYGVDVGRLPMPWWKWNRLWREGAVDEKYLEEFNRTTVG